MGSRYLLTASMGFAQADLHTVVFISELGCAATIHFLVYVVEVPWLTWTAYVAPKPDRTVPVG